MAIDEQTQVWEILYDRIRKLLQQFGTENFRRTADFWVHDDNWGTLQHKIYIRNLNLLRPPVVKLLQRLLSEFPDWEIMVAVSVPGDGEAWPDMGLTIRAHEIVDGLQRQYFPKEFQGLKYQGSRRGTDRD
jgi:hypothetical protein